MDIESVFNEYKAVTCMCQYFSKTKNRCSHAMEQATKEAFEIMHYNDTIKTKAKAYFSNRECSVQETVYSVLPELRLRRIFPVGYFVNTNPPEERIQCYILKKN